jgi:iron-sulfur cluster repair protein YtfE (RIC family)
MNLDDLRRELVAEHAELKRRLLDLSKRAQGLGVQPRRHRNGSAQLAELREDFLRFAALMEAHLEREESALYPILPTLDAWGSERARALVDEHRSEHESLLEATSKAGAQTSPGELARAVVRLAEELIAHFEEEEEVLLNPDVLTESIVRVSATD